MSQHLKMSHELKKKHVPINLARKAQRERRIRNGGIGRNRKRNRMKRLRKKKKQNFELSELETLVSATENHLKEILANDEQLSDIPYDVTPEELQGELALAQGGGTTIYIERDGLSTLTVVLPQENPTIAQLKRAIEAQARVQQKRELRERYEERIRRRGLSGTAETIVEEHKHKQVNKSTKNNLGKPQYATGELVCSATHNGHQHRPNVSWRFLWRAYILFNIATQTFVEDKNGRKLLKECGIENAQTLKFYKRDKYFGKKRQ
ncbi:uncharacterized protein LOC111676658 isoform X1 [Lucilia cuprina]|uniref:uncharacterized protein LOC111676658 isoform X1 n=1 Tax=Lucilia cuprina TaxID=7375 RepID=UPI001F0611BD|nr:uncharacterized protein LOC111676658 isoform X1 [Lucilia cuprina]